MTTGQLVIVRYFYADEVWDSQHRRLEEPRDRRICIQWLWSPDPIADERAAEIDELARHLAARAREVSGDSARTPVPRFPEESKLLDRFREAASDYLAERLTGPSPIATQAWSTTGLFLPAEVASAIAKFSDGLNGRLTESLRELAKTGGIAGVGGDIAAGVGADMILRPIAVPLNTSVESLELVGLAIGLMIGAPALAVLCAKGLLHQKATELAAKIINGPLTANTSWTGRHALEEATTGQPTPQGDATSAPRAQDPRTRLMEAGNDDAAGPPAEATGPLTI